MHQLSLIIVFLSLSLASLCQSQIEMNKEARATYEKTDNELNRVYKDVIEEYSGDAEFIKNLKASERLRIKFRDAEILLKYPENNDVRNGSVFPLCYYGYLTKLTQQRIDTLKVWLEGEPEGEVCGGSVKVR